MPPLTTQTIQNTMLSQINWVQKEKYCTFLFYVEDKIEHSIWGRMGHTHRSLSILSVILVACAVDPLSVLVREWGLPRVDHFSEGRGCPAVDQTHTIAAGQEEGPQM